VQKDDRNFIFGYCSMEQPFGKLDRRKPPFSPQRSLAPISGPSTRGAAKTEMLRFAEAEVQVESPNDRRHFSSRVYGGQA
jgi:hypothetical protein